MLCCSEHHILLQQQLWWKSNVQLSDLLLLTQCIVALILNMLCFDKHTESVSPQQTFDKILIANRGEIACRVSLQRNTPRVGYRTKWSSPINYRRIHRVSGPNSDIWDSRSERLTANHHLTCICSDLVADDWLSHHIGEIYRHLETCVVWPHRNRKLHLEENPDVNHLPVNLKVYAIIETLFLLVCSFIHTGSMLRIRGGGACNKAVISFLFHTYFSFYFYQVIKTCRKMGIKSVAVHSDVDSSAVSFPLRLSSVQSVWGGPSCTARGFLSTLQVASCLQ